MYWLWLALPATNVHSDGMLVVAALRPVVGPVLLLTLTMRRLWIVETEADWLVERKQAVIGDI